MTDEKILELAVDAFGIHYDRLDARFTNFARAVLAAGASEGQAEPIYQVGPHEGKWVDVPEHAFNVTPDAFRRIVYAVPQPDASAEIAALRERIAGMEKDAARWRIAREFEYVTDFEVLGIDQRIDAGFAKEKQS